MAEENTSDDGRCLPCDIVFYLLCGLGGLAIGVIAFDAMSGGQASAWIDRVFAKAGPVLASVSPIREQGNDAAGA